MEAEVRKLNTVFEDQIAWSIRMGGLLKNWAEYDGTQIRSPKDVGKHWDEVGEKYKIPISAGIWEDAPLISSYPACIATKSAQLTSPEKAEIFLRSMRELLFVGMFDINTPHAIEKAALMSEISPVDLFENMQEGKVQFDEDMKFAKMLGIRVLPTFIIEISGEVEILRGFQTYDKLLETVMHLGKTRLNPKHEPQFSTLFHKYDSLTAREVALYLGTEQPQAEKILENEIQSGRFNRVQTQTGTLYHKKSFYFNRHLGLLRSNQKSIIIGAGVAGLGTAMVLEKHRIPYTVFEVLEDRFVNMITGMVITDEVFHELEKNGFPLSCLSPETELRSILQINGQTGERTEAPLKNHYSIDRLALLDSLSEYADKSQFHYNSKLTGISGECTENTGIVINEKESYEAEFIFGTDGIHSKVRAAVIPGISLRKSSVYEILIPFESISIQTKIRNRLIKVLAAEQGFIAGLLSLGKGKNLIYIQVNIQKIDIVDHENKPCDVHNVIENAIHIFNHNTDNLLSDLRYNKHYIWKTSDMDIPNTFNKGNIMILGDAAHAMLPFTSQGACSALLDCLTLHNLLNSDKHKGRLSPQLFEEVYNLRKDTLQTHLDFGREMEDKFLTPEKYGARQVVPFSK